MQLLLGTLSCSFGERHRPYIAASEYHIMQELRQAAQGKLVPL